MKLVINRRVWLRGEENNESALLRTRDSKRCCVGIYLSALGVPDDGVSDLGAAEDVARELLPAEAEWLLSKDSPDLGLGSDIAYELYACNDSQDLDDGTREARIAEVFASQGVEVKFTNGEDC